ncbi:hypothetical protein BGZ92_000368 [Podila epicladia]|nr:hypothetical protein BGZ92_000368 [Podila epicladia]
MHSKTLQLAAIVFLYHLVLVRFVTSAPLPVIVAMKTLVKPPPAPHTSQTKKAKVLEQARDLISHRVERPNPFLIHNLENTGHGASHFDLASALGIHIV